MSAARMSGSLTVAIEPVHARRSFFFFIPLAQRSLVFAKKRSTGVAVGGESISQF